MHGTVRVGRILGRVGNKSSHVIYRPEFLICLSNIAFSSDLSILGQHFDDWSGLNATEVSEYQYFDMIQSEKVLSSGLVAGLKNCSLSQELDDVRDAFFGLSVWSKGEFLFKSFLGCIRHRVGFHRNGGRIYQTSWGALLELPLLRNAFVSGDFKIYSQWSIVAIEVITYVDRSLGLGSQIGILEGMISTLFDMPQLKGYKKPILSGEVNGKGCLDKGQGQVYIWGGCLLSSETNQNITGGGRGRGQNKHDLVA